MKKKVQNPDAPATKHDVALVQSEIKLVQKDMKLVQDDIKLVQKDLQHDLELMGGHLSSGIVDLEEQITEVKEEQASQRHILESILKAVESTEGRAQETRGDHEQIEKHEERITSVEVQVRMLQK